MDWLWFLVLEGMVLLFGKIEIIVVYLGLEKLCEKMLVLCLNYNYKRNIYYIWFVDNFCFLLN